MFNKLGLLSFAVTLTWRPTWPLYLPAPSQRWARSRANTKVPKCGTTATAVCSSDWETHLVCLSQLFVNLTKLKYKPVPRILLNIYVIGNLLVWCYQS